jgi:predicted RNA-binding protein with PUA-like domain
MVDVTPVRAMKIPVKLTTIKAHPFLSQMVFVRQSRLSVSPIDEKEWQEILKLTPITGFSEINDL